MNYLVYYLIVYPISRLPFFILYGLSDFARLILYRLVGYRKKVVYANLKNSFPDKSEKEIRQIMGKFYKHFCDLIFESVKAFTISEKEASGRMAYTNIEILEELKSKGKDIILIGGHYGNWELLAITINNATPYQSRALYTPLRNKFWDGVMSKSRSRFGLQLYSIKQVREMFQAQSKVPVMTIFGSDQSPRKPKRAYWTKFLNQDTGFQFGAEKYAKEFGQATVFAAIRRIKRGHFTTEFSLLYPESSNLPHGTITDSFCRKLEDQIRKDPPYYLWTHKRWKHKKPADLEIDS